MDAIPKKRAKRASKPAEPARLVYTQAPVLLGRLIERRDTTWQVDLGTVQREASVDPSVDPVLLDEAHAAGARVLLEAGATPTIVGVVATRRAIEIDREGNVSAKVGAFTIDAKDEVLLKIPGAFVRAKAREVEVYGERVITRARNLAKILAAMIKLN